MNVKQNYYKSKINYIKISQVNILKKIDNFSIIRLLVVLFGLILFYIGFNFTSYIGIIILLFFIFLFSWIVVKHNRLYFQKEENQNLLQIFQNEINLFNNTNIFGNGIMYKNSSHEYSSDLDIFGKHSLFNLINRTVTIEGERLLANWLISPLDDKNSILERQSLIKELAKKEEFREKFLRFLFISNKLDNKINIWVNTFKYFFIDKIIFRIFLFGLSFIIISLLLIGVIFPVWWKYAFLLSFVNYFILLKYQLPVNRAHNHISKHESLFLKYSGLIELIKKEKFQSSYLDNLQNQLKCKNQIEKQLKILSGIIKKLDYRLNPVLGSSLNLLLFWDIHFVYKIEKWMKKNSSEIQNWLKVIGEFDAYLSLSILYFNNPDWVFPTINTEGLMIEGNNIGHPLIEKKYRVLNDYSIKGEARFDIVTGSNMAGKSTFLRTIGINSVLALNGCPVCADLFTISNISLITYMRISDSLEDNLSTFRAELERIKSILQYVEESNNCFLLLDELLKGTNSQDRHLGTVAFIKQMIHNKASGLIATHDIELTNMIEKYPNNIRNFNFSVKTKDDDLFFDYKLTNGVCNNFNASLLMKKIGINIDFNN